MIFGVRRLVAAFTTVMSHKSFLKTSQLRVQSGDKSPHSKIAAFLLVVALTSVIFPLSMRAQDARELQQERAASNKLKGEHPLFELMRTRKSTLRPELMGVHPRVYVTDKEIAELRERARGSHRQLWQESINRVRALAGDPPPPPATGRRQ